MAFKDSSYPKEATAQIVQVAQQQNFSRSNIATTRRAVQDLKDQTQKLSNAILQIAATSPDVTKEAFEEAWQRRQQLNLVKQQLESLEHQIGDCLPQTSTARLTEKERKEIQGLYSSGLYTQGQLAEHYGVTQPTISDIAKSPKIKLDFDELTAMFAHPDRSVAGFAMGPASLSEKVTDDAINHPALGKENLSLATSLWVHFRGGVGACKLSATKAAMSAIRAQAPLATSISFDSCLEESLGENIQILIIASGLKRKKNNAGQLAS